MNRRVVVTLVVIGLLFGAFLTTVQTVNPSICATQTLYERPLHQLDDTFTGVSGQFYLASGAIKSERYYGYTAILRDGGKASDTVPENIGVVYEDVKDGTPWMAKKSAINTAWGTACFSEEKPESVPPTSISWYEFHVKPGTVAYSVNLPGK